MRASAMGVALVLLGLACGQTAPAYGQAADYPARPVRIVVPYPAGGSLDAITRVLAASLSESLKQQFIVENRAGAGGTVGSAAAARAEPDGYTLLAVVDSHAINPSLYKRLPYDTVKDFEPITFFGRSPLVLTVASSVPATDVDSYVRLARARPGEMSYGSLGLGSQPHLAGESFKRLAKVELLHVPYRGGGPAINDLVAGHLKSMFMTPVAGYQHVRSGAMRGLGIAARKRSALLPDVPTMAEAGYPLISEYWYGMLAPAGTPRESIVKLDSALRDALAKPEVARRLAEMGLEVEPLASLDFGRFIGDQITLWSDFIRDNAIATE